jgi:ubiquinone/menaquinone biosynthesis C-methylase UbiE
LSAKTAEIKTDKEAVHNQNIEAFNKWAASYDGSFLGKLALGVQKRILPYLKDADFDSLLDIACGTGVLLKEVEDRFAKTNQTIKLAGIDLSPRMLDIAKRTLGEEVDLREGEADGLPWQAKSFDVVTCTNAFHHFPEPAAVLSEVKRVLTPGGLFIIEDIWLPPFFRQIANLFLPLSPEGDVRIYSRGELVSMLSITGFMDIKWQRLFIYGGITTATRPRE